MEPNMIHAIYLNPSLRQCQCHRQLFRAPSVGGDRPLSSRAVPVLSVVAATMLALLKISSWVTIKKRVLAPLWGSLLQSRPPKQIYWWRSKNLRQLSVTIKLWPPKQLKRSKIRPMHHRLSKYKTLKTPKTSQCEKDSKVPFLLRLLMSPKVLILHRKQMRSINSVSKHSSRTLWIIRSGPSLRLVREEVEARGLSVWKTHRLCLISPKLATRICLHRLAAPRTSTLKTDTQIKSLIDSTG